MSFCQYFRTTGCFGCYFDLLVVIKKNFIIFYHLVVVTGVAWNKKSALYLESGYARLSASLFSHLGLHKGLSSRLG